ncbi:DUF4231 domain-containing protein [Streptomyces sp. NPDC056708]|uniref:DUF4231 domain-containing protein n=1 Tax=unclassified Streptomyces TaxID=2593676 RepID=UPI0036BFD1A7
MAELQDRLETDRASLRRASALAPVALHERRGLYREEVAEVIEHYQVESRKYRRVHNSLQSLVMVGSTTITTVAALDAKQWTWQTISVIVLGFCVTLASTFTGYYKYRERSYFLQQTADAIEEESNALSLGVGEYSLFSSDQEDQALAKFTQRVEVLRNEQRRRQQQLDSRARGSAESFWHLTNSRKADVCRSPASPWGPCTGSSTTAHGVSRHITGGDARAGIFLSCARLGQG